MTPASWIAEVRERLAAPAPQALATEGARLATLAPLFVDGGELWLLLRGPSGGELVPGAASLPSSPVDSGSDDPWPAALRGTSPLRLDVTAVLRLGTLDHIPSPLGDVVIPCVATVPPPPRDGAAGATGPAIVRLPLRAARAPTLLEKRHAVIKGVETWMTVAHFGPVKLAGVEAEVVELLLERLF